MIKLIVNNRIYYEEDENLTLMNFLRDKLHLKSIKNGCNQGACGTCTVVINGKAIKACVQRLKNLNNARIITVEGLSEREQSVYTYAFGEVGAVQCGFCIPGMVMCAKALLDKNLNPLRSDIAFAIRNNICRCTGYKKIIEAIDLSARYFRENKEIPLRNYSGRIGSDSFRIDVDDKVLGKAVYVDDIEIPGMIYASAVRSRYPRAKVISIDYSEAEKLEGVVRIFTAKDIPGENKVGHLKHDWNTFIAEGEITHFLGDAICLVAAENETILEKAKQLIKIEYEELTPIASIEDALKEDAPILHEGGNVLSNVSIKRGNAEEVINNSKYKVTNIYKTPIQEHAFLEPEVAIAKPFDDKIYIYSTDQSTFDVRREVSIMLGIDQERIIVENVNIGGGFGGKEDVSVQHLAALVAYYTKRIVKCKLTRDESLIFHPKKHPFTIEITTACDENGILTAMKANIISDTGAYASLGGPVLQRACTHAAGPYNYQNIDIEGTAVYTNNPPAGAFRGFGVTQTCFATECNINQLAKMVGIDEWEFRYRNAIRPSQSLPNGQIVGEDTGLIETLEAVKDVFYNNKYVGIACAMKNSGVGVGLPDYGRAKLRVENNKVMIYSGQSDIGQGSNSVLVSIVCHTLGLSQRDVKCVFSNTSNSPDSGTTSGSRQTLVTGEAAKRAAEQLKKELETKTLEQLNGAEFFGEYYAKTDKFGIDMENPVSHVAYGYATHVCVLDENGTIKEIVAAHDVGKAILPKSIEGQIEGGVVMSIGYALTEKYTLENCIPKVKFGTLGLMRADKVPEIKSIIIEKEGLEFAYGAKGIGEIVCIPTPPAIQSAFEKYNGVFQTELPLKKLEKKAD